MDLRQKLIDLSRDATGDPTITVAGDFQPKGMTWKVVAGAAAGSVLGDAAGGDILTNSGNSVYALSFSGVTRNDPPAKPTLLNPADEAVFGDSTSIMLKSSAFSDPEGDAQTGLTCWG